MVSDFIEKIDKLIRWSFYLLFFLVPLIMWPSTFELFEFNKMWFVFGMSIFIGFLWGAKIILQRRIEIRRTPLDIPIALFLLSQIISTIFSMEPHTSFWGYYSRFNGGLLSTISYIFLYYAFATNLIHNPPAGGENENHDPIGYKLLVISLLSGLAVTLWGLPSHFGSDPTCLLFRGTADVSCWTEAFQPTIRIFSTLGQPNWMGAFLAALIPISLGFGLYKVKENRNALFPILYLLLSVLFYLALLFTRSQSSFAGLAIGLLVFLAFIFYRKKSSLKQSLKGLTAKYLLISFAVLFAITFFAGSPIGTYNRFATLNGIKNIISKSPAAQKSGESIPVPQGLENSSDIQLGGSQSSDIRLIVWQGAIELFKRNPLFGTGVETYGFAYYQVKPLAHNLTSEWDYLYNKAHNEYLNYLATTGAFGFTTYILIIGFFLFYSVRHFLKHRDSQYFPISLGILAGYISILVSNFFGFSVVIVNLFLFLFPILLFDLENGKLIRPVIGIPKNAENYDGKIAPPRAIAIVVLGLIALYYEFYLLNFWNADKKYAYGNNLDKASEYVQAYTYLNDAVKMLPSEDLYKDELSINMATLSLLLAENKEATQAALFGQQARALSDEVVARHPKNVVYLKTRARVMFALSEIDESFLDVAIQTIDNARKLAPTDAKLAYNEGLFYQQKGDSENAIRYLNEAIKLKPNYYEPNYSLALIYQQEAKNNPSRASEYKEKMREVIDYVLKNIDPNNKPIKDLLDSL